MWVVSRTTRRGAARVVGDRRVKCRCEYSPATPDRSLPVHRSATSTLPNCNQRPGCCGRMSPRLTARPRVVILAGRAHATSSAENSSALLSGREYRADSGPIGRLKAPRAARVVGCAPGARIDRQPVAASVTATVSACTAPPRRRSPGRDAARPMARRSKLRPRSGRGRRGGSPRPGTHRRPGPWCGGSRPARWAGP
jgi:hypothetical protein